MNQHKSIGGVGVARHESITEGRVLEACESAAFDLSYLGFCLACGADADSVEPDAERYICVECGESAVMGADNVMLAIERCP